GQPGRGADEGQPARCRDGGPDERPLRRGGCAVRVPAHTSQCAASDDDGGGQGLPEGTRHRARCRDIGPTELRPGDVGRLDGAGKGQDRQGRGRCIVASPTKEAGHRKGAGRMSTTEHEGDATQTWLAFKSKMQPAAGKPKARTPRGRASYERDGNAPD